MTASDSILVEKNQEFYDALSNATIQIKYNTHEMFDDKVLELTDFEISFELMYILDELNNTVDSIVKGVFD